jgi:uncharacterized membrane-anchored protein
MKNFSSILIFIMGLVIVFLMLKKNPDAWFSTLLITFCGSAAVVLFFYIKKKLNR